MEAPRKHEFPRTDGQVGKVLERRADTTALGPHSLSPAWLKSINPSRDLFLLCRPRSGVSLTLCPWALSLKEFLKGWEASIGVGHTWLGPCIPVNPSGSSLSPSVLVCEMGIVTLPYSA